MTPPTRLRVLLNANAGKKSGIPSITTTADDIRKLLDSHSVVADLVETVSEEHAREQVRDAMQHGYRAVIAAGGDGTAGLVASELIGSETALGILPLGSIMNVGRMLGIPRLLDEAVAILARGQVRSIDVGRANDQLFFECASVGMIAPVFREVQRMEETKLRGALAAIFAVLRYRPARMIIHLDDRVMTTRSLLVTVANGPYTGMGLTVAPDALLDDGLFDVQVFRRFGRFGLAWYLTTVAFGRTRYTPSVRTYRSASVRIESVHPLPCRADGNDLGTTPVTLDIVSGALRVIAPVVPSY